MARKNYRQVKKQKEDARKARQAEKQQRRLQRADEPVTGTDSAAVNTAHATDDQSLSKEQ